MKFLYLHRGTVLPKVILLAIIILLSYNNFKNSDSAPELISFITNSRVITGKKYETKDTDDNFIEPPTPYGGQTEKYLIQLNITKNKNKLLQTTIKTSPKVLRIKFIRLTLYDGL